jgi:hypothetical protein
VVSRDTASVMASFLMTGSPLSIAKVWSKRHQIFNHTGQLGTLPRLLIQQAGRSGLVVTPL